MIDDAGIKTTEAPNMSVFTLNDLTAIVSAKDIDTNSARYFYAFAELYQRGEVTESMRVPANFNANEYRLPSNIDDGDMLG